MKDLWASSITMLVSHVICHHWHQEAQGLTGLGLTGVKSLIPSDQQRSKTRINIGLAFPPRWSKLLEEKRLKKTKARPKLPDFCGRAKLTLIQSHMLPTHCNSDRFMLSLFVCDIINKIDLMNCSRTLKLTLIWLRLSYALWCYVATRVILATNRIKQWGVTCWPGGVNIVHFTFKAEFKCMYVYARFNCIKLLNK